jgi:predicted nucleic acid-binding protein
LAGDPIVVPQAVADEIERFGPSDPTAMARRNLGWLKLVASEPLSPLIEHWDLGGGEAAVLAWALGHRGATAVLDDLAARRCAHTLGIPVRGTLGLILVAKQRRIIATARPVLEQLRQGGMYLSEDVLNRALRSVGE